MAEPGSMVKNLWDSGTSSRYRTATRSKQRQCLLSRNCCIRDCRNSRQLACVRWLKRLASRRAITPLVGAPVSP